MDFNQRLLNLSSLGAHSNFAGQGFRQKDVRFLVELLTNWLDSLLKPDVPQWHNTQIMRHMDRLVEIGHCKCKGSGKNKNYRLTRIGILELIYQSIELKGACSFQNVLLIYYFIRSYEYRMTELITREGSGFSKAVKLEIHQLFDHKKFLQDQQQYFSQEIQRMKLRVSETQAASDMAIKLQRSGESASEIIRQVSLSFPYELQAQKPMEELFKEIEPEIQIWELSHGNQFRSQILWKSQLDLLESQLKILRNLGSQN